MELRKTCRHHTGLASESVLGSVFLKLHVPNHDQAFRILAVVDWCVRSGEQFWELTAPVETGDQFVPTPLIVVEHTVFREFHPRFVFAAKQGRD